MAVREFQGIPSIQEVECLGRNLGADVKLISLMMFTVPDNRIIASLNVMANTCLTHTEYSSCFIDTDNTRGSRLRVLEHQLVGGESKEYGCEVNTVNPRGKTKSTTWSVSVTAKRKSENNASTRRSRRITACLAYVFMWKK